MKYLNCVYYSFVLSQGNFIELSNITMMHPNSFGIFEISQTTKIYSVNFFYLISGA